MVGESHSLRERSEGPFALDGYYPLYTTASAAQAASVRGGGDGQAYIVGPAAELRGPAAWTLPPGTQVFHMPRTGAKLHLGDYVAPFTLDGYFPLYRERADARKASDDGRVQSHGPGSESGHPSFWSNGEHRVFYMPVMGSEKFYGSYQSRDRSAILPSDDYAGALLMMAPAGEGSAQAAAAQATAAASALMASTAVSATPPAR
eukprot:CAMPEP_0179068970 /NCGR_PEP_ID=MMETSP0796-20121207/30269_1 /TAXON_ID=73915 /ORGANISM="Pyrodinium bahamense, Strain pbaha01" /LENGTH=203 /DNA_ID=CAMNT_0020766027 /DNA_START=170 /DNA_END=781 /DNA_ORIENTATION=+